MVFSGTFTAGGAKVDWSGGRAYVKEEGRSRKFVSAVQQISYSASYGFERGQTVLYVTERAVFRLQKGGLELIEIAPGIDLEKDILNQMEFRPAISPDLKEMDHRIFMPDPIGMAGELKSKPKRKRAVRLTELGWFQNVELGDR